MGRSKEFDENAVLQKAMELFWEQGYEKTSMNELVQHMGIHRRSLYDTFGDKHALYLKAIDRYGEYSTDKIKSETLHAKTSKQAIQSIFDYMVEGNEDKRWGCLFVNATTELAPWDKEVEEKAEEAFSQAEDFFTKIIREGQQAGEFSCAYDAKAFAEMMHTMLLGIRVLKRTSTSKEKMHRMADFYLNMLCN